MNVLSQCGHSSKIPVRDLIADSCSTADGSVVGHYSRIPSLPEQT